MWIFLPGGLLMPAAVPMNKVDAKWTNGGEWNLQVRARTLSHLTNFIRDFMTEGTYSEIQSTPEMDYNYRFYTSKVSFATAMASAMLQIDYQKFKPMAEDRYDDGTLKYMDGKEYHSVLNSIWGTVCRLGRPGGKWAIDGSAWGNAVSKYTGKKYGTTTTNQDWLRAYDEMIDSRSRTTGWDDSTNEDGGLENPHVDLFADVRARQQDTGAWTEIDDSKWEEEAEHHMTSFSQAWLEDDDYLPSSADRKERLLEMVEDLPADQWSDWLSDVEMHIVSAEYKRQRERDRENRKQFRASVEALNVDSKHALTQRKGSKRTRIRHSEQKATRRVAGQHR